MDIYPQSITFEVPFNENDYVIINIDLSIDKNNTVKKFRLKKF